jgi:hypothetical protein
LTKSSAALQVGKDLPAPCVIQVLWAERIGLGGARC